MTCSVCAVRTAACARRLKPTSRAAEPSPSAHQSAQSPRNVSSSAPCALLELARRSRGSWTARAPGRRTRSPRPRRSRAGTRLGPALSASRPCTRRCSRSNGYGARRPGLGQAERLVRAGVRVAARARARRGTPAAGRRASPYESASPSRLPSRYAMPCGLSVCQTSTRLPLAVAQWNARGSDVAAGQVRRRARRPSCARPRGSARPPSASTSGRPGGAPGTSVCIAVDDLDAVRRRSSSAKRSCRASSSIDSRLGVQRERQRARLEPPAAQVAEQLLARRPRPRREPALERQVALDRPAEAVVRRGEVERRVEVGEVVAQHARLRVGVAEVEVGVVDEVDAPAPLRQELELVAPPRAALELALEPDARRAVDGRARRAARSSCRRRARRSPSSSRRPAAAKSEKRARPRRSGAAIASRTHWRRPSGERRSSGRSPARIATPPSSRSMPVTPRAQLAARPFRDRRLGERDARREGAAPHASSRDGEERVDPLARLELVAGARDDDELGLVARGAPALGERERVVEQRVERRRRRRAPAAGRAGRR